MGYRLKPVVIVVIAAITSALFICVGLLAYKLKTSGSVSDLWGLHASHTSSDDPLMYEEQPIEDGVGPINSSQEEWAWNIRLNPAVYPVHYRLHLHPDFERGVFTGHVSIELNVTATCDHIRLHTKYLNISSTELFEVGAKSPVQIKNTFEHDANEYWVVEPKEELTSSAYNLTLHFNGSLTRGIVGFYRSQYFDAATNTTKYVVSSKFQPTYARRAFPCFDEPSFKSTFKVSLVKPSDLTALSNMPIEGEEAHEEGDLTVVHYQNSVPMVTYLVAFAIGDFGYREGVTQSGIPVRIYATSPNAKYAEYAASITPKIVDYFEDYFGIKYPLPKLDIIGVPDFVSGAMEHWGLISFRELNLLHNPEKGSPATKQRVTAVISHELAHMWFGNLVTLKWWNDLWLNEGFASYMEYGGMNAVQPDWEIESQFVSLDLAPVLQLDGQLSSHPIVQHVSHPNQINEIFDTISYQKGASVIRMLKYFMGPKNFRDGVSKFLKKFAFKNAVTKDLWDELQSEAPSGVNISFVMDTWTRQMGYPVLTVSSDTAGTVSVSQQRYFENPDKRSATQKSPFGYRWEIPLLISTSEGPSSTQLVWLPLAQKSVTLDASSATSWIKVNTGQLGYYRVKYELNSLQKISRDFHAKFSPEERCGLVDDAFSLAFANYTEYGSALELGLEMKDETHVVPWKCADNHFRKLLSLLNYASPDNYGLYRKYLNEITEALYKRLDWTDSEADPHLQRLLKPRLISLACEHGNQECRNQAKTIFLEWLKSDAYIVPINLRGVIYKWGVWQSDDQVWDKVWQRYLKEEDPAEKVTLLQALASSQEPWVISRLLDYAKHETLVRRQDYFMLSRFIASHPVGNSVLWNYYRNQMDYLIDRFTLQDRYFGRMISDITNYFTTETQLESMQIFFSRYPEAGAGTRARESALENVQNNILWTRRSLNSISGWLRSRY